MRASCSIRKSKPILLRFIFLGNFDKVPLRLVGRRWELLRLKKIQRVIILVQT